MPKPSVLFQWAYGSDASVSEPPKPSKSRGWVPRVPIPAAFINWCFNSIGEWIEWLELRADLYTSLDELVDALGDEETGELLEYDADSLPGSSLDSFAAGASVVDLAVDGKYVYVATASEVKRYHRATKTLTTTYTKTNAGTIARLVVSGGVVVIAYGTYVECFEATGASRWVFDHGATVRDVAIDATRAYLVGAPDSNIQLRARLLTNGSDAWAFQHGTAGEDLYSVATDGRTVFVAGDTTGLASGANLRAINASNGYDATGEGLAGTDTAGLAWNAVTATDVISGGCLAVDASRLYVGYQSAVTIESRSKLTGAIRATVTPPSSMVVQRLSVDQDWLIAGSSVTGDVAVALAKEDLSAAWRFNSSGGAFVATDGAALWASTGSTVHKVARGNRSESWTRVAASDAGLPYRWLAIPQR